MFCTYNVRKRFQSYFYQIMCIEMDFVLNFAHLTVSTAIVKTANRLSLLSTIKRLLTLTLLLFFTCDFFK